MISRPDPEREIYEASHLLRSSMSRTQIHVTIGLLLLAHLLIAPLGMPADRGSPAFPLVLGALIAQPALLAIWAALAPLALVPRLLQAMTVLALIYLAADFASVLTLDGNQAPGGIMGSVAWLTCCFACQLPLWLLRVPFRWQLCLPAALAIGPESQDNRFSLRGLLIAIAVVAAMFAALRSLHPASADVENPGRHVLLYVAIGGLMSLPGLLVVAVGWIVLTRGRRLWRCMVGIVSACAVGSVAIAVALAGSAGEVGELVFALVGTLSCATATLLVVRLCGYRLDRSKCGGEWELAEKPIASAVASSRRRFAAVCSSLVIVLAGLAALLPARLQVWREKAEERQWRNAGLYVAIADGRVVVASTNDGSQHALETEVIDRLGLCHDLTQLDLSGSTVDDETLERLPALPNLRLLSLTATRVSDHGLRHLLKFSKLTDIGLRLADVSDDGLAALAKLSEAARIDVGHTRVTSRGIKRLRRLRPDLRVNSTTDDLSLGRLAGQFRPQFTAISQPSGWRPVVVRMHAVGPGVTDRSVAALRGMSNTSTSLWKRPIKPLGAACLDAGNMCWKREYKSARLARDKSSYSFRIAFLPVTSPSSTKSPGLASRRR